jgi:hypothetical protein
MQSNGEQQASHFYITGSQGFLWIAHIHETTWAVLIPTT